MVGVTEWDTALTSLQTAFNIAKTMVDLRDARAFQAKVIEFQRAIMEAQSSAIAANTAHASLIDQVSALKTEMANLKAWDAEKQKYELQELGVSDISACGTDGVDCVTEDFWLIVVTRRERR